MHCWHFFISIIRGFIKSLKKLYDDNITTNGEFYIDNLINSAIELGFNVKNYIVDDYICWGTPNDYNTFQYWRNFLMIIKIIHMI